MLLIFHNHLEKKLFQQTIKMRHTLTKSVKNLWFLTLHSPNFYKIQYCYNIKHKKRTLYVTYAHFKGFLQIALCFVEKEMILFF
ncbi:hypothetical protein H7S25_02095 [Bacillus aerophilus]|nr:hypothetical protein [Bacillus pumilus]MBT2260414.1 hypothetical protein [Bacillus safensis]MBY0188738.1 hypothetical protein [Bacillus aerophilus]